MKTLILFGLLCGSASAQTTFYPQPGNEAIIMQPNGRAVDSYAQPDGKGGTVYWQQQQQPQQRSFEQQQYQMQNGWRQFCPGHCN
jgi:hypothetical protein